MFDVCSPTYCTKLNWINNSSFFLLYDMYFFFFSSWQHWNQIEVSAKKISKPQPLLLTKCFSRRNPEVSFYLYIYFWNDHKIDNSIFCQIITYIKKIVKIISMNQATVVCNFSRWIEVGKRVGNYNLVCRTYLSLFHLESYCYILREWLLP